MKPISKAQHSLPSTGAVPSRAPSRLRFWPLLAALALPLGCQKDEPPPPLPAPPAASATTDTAPIELLPEAPPPEPTASATATPTKTGGSSGSSIKKCCAALRQNAESAPEPNKTYMLQAAAVCDAGAQMPAITSMLKGAGLPTACK